MKHLVKTDADKLDELVRLARRLGATNAAIISAADIVIEDALAELCREPRCPNYGLSAGCPPHVAGPAGFRQLLKRFDRALTFKIDVPTAILFSEERSEVFKLLHEITVDLEQTAVRLGYSHSRGFAGGSCKMIFCRAQADCSELTGRGKCRQPGSARPSMSGFGINVSRLMAAAGWNLNVASRHAQPGKDKVATVCALLLLG